MTAGDKAEKEAPSECVDAKAMEEYGHWQRINRLVSTVLWPLGLCLCATLFMYGACYCGVIDSYAGYSAIICAAICYVYFFCFLANFKPGKRLRVVMFVASGLVLLAWLWCLLWFLRYEKEERDIVTIIAFGLLFFGSALFALFFSLSSRLAGWRFARKAPERREKKMRRLRNVLARKTDAFLRRHPSLALSSPKEFVFLSGGWPAVVIVALAVPLTAYFYIGGVEWGDWTIPDEDSLRLEERDVPDKDNAFVALMALTNLYAVADDDQATETSGGDSQQEISDKDFVRYYGDPFNREDSEGRAAVRSDPASPKRAEKILANNVKFFEAFRTALSRKDFKAPESIIPGRSPYVSNLPMLKPIIDFARLISLNAQIEFENGNVKVAINDVRNIHSLGQMLAAKTDARSSGFVLFLVGELLKEFAYGKMCDFIVMGKTTDEMLDTFVKMVDEDDAVAPANRERALKAEWDVHFRSVDWFCDVVHKSATYDEFIQTIWGGLDEREFPRPWKAFDWELRMLWHWPGAKKFCLHRHEMKFLLAKELRETLAKDLDATIARTVPPDRKWYWYFLPNVVGRIMLVGSPPNLYDFFAKHSLARSRTRIILAAEKWRRAHGGKNPPTLDVLVPAYLASVPKDPWSKSGEPIKYDATLGVAWSVGKDGKYDYRKVAKERETGGNNMPVDVDTQKYAFRLDGKPINNETNNAGGGTKHQAGNDVDATNDRRTKTPDGIQGSGNEIVNGVKWTFVITNGNASVSVIPPSFTAIPRSTSGELTIPSILGGCPVTSIGKFSFNCCDKITYVKIPDSVTSIGSWAFQLCTDLKGVIFSGNAPRLECGAFNSVASDCTVYVPKGSKGWGCTIPGTWNGLKICYGIPECDVESEVQPKEKLRKEENPPADVRRRHWLVPVASCRTAMRGRYDSRAFISGMDRGLVEGEVISPSVGKCGYRVLSISDNCVWFEAFYDDEPPKDKLPHVTWPDFSRIDTISPTPPPGCLMLGKRKFWLGDAIKLPSGFYLMVDDFLDGKAAVFRLLDSVMRPVRDLLCVIVREEK